MSLSLFFFLEAAGCFFFCCCFFSHLLIFPNKTLCMTEVQSWAVPYPELNVLASWGLLMALGRLVASNQLLSGGGATSQKTLTRVTVIDILADSLSALERKGPGDRIHLSVRKLLLNKVSHRIDGCYWEICGRLTYAGMPVDWQPVELLPPFGTLPGLGDGGGDQLDTGSGVLSGLFHDHKIKTKKEGPEQRERSLVTVISDDVSCLFIFEPIIKLHLWLPLWTGMFGFRQGELELHICQKSTSSALFIACKMSGEFHQNSNHGERRCGTKAHLSSIALLFRKNLIPLHFPQRNKSFQSVLATRNFFFPPVSYWRLGLYLSIKMQSAKTLVF